jgi:3-phytase
MTRPRTWLLGAAAVVATAATVFVVASRSPADPSPWTGPAVTPTVQTPPSYGEKDAADDPAIWVHPRDPALSLVIGTNKKDPGGLQVFDLHGRERQFLRSGELNNVDLRDDFPFVSGPGTLVAATDRTRDAVAVFRIHPRARTLEQLGTLPTGLREVYGLCLYRSPRTGAFHVFVSTEQGQVRQYELTSTRRRLSMDAVRSFDLGGKGEGCAADDEHGQLYLTREQRGLLRLAAEPDEGGDPVIVDEAGVDGENLVPDVEGVAIYDAGEGQGYVVVSSQGNSTFAVYRRGGSHEYLGSFAVRGGSGIDGASQTDGIAVTSSPLDDRFPAGLLVVHDQDNHDADTSNFKFVDWGDVARSMGLDPAGDEDAVADRPPAEDEGGRGRHGGW